MRASHRGNGARSVGTCSQPTPFHSYVAPTGTPLLGNPVAPPNITTRPRIGSYAVAACDAPGGAVVSSWSHRGDSIAQLLEQPSPLARFPSSHSSLSAVPVGVSLSGSTMPLPHVSFD